MAIQFWGFAGEWSPIDLGQDGQWSALSFGKGWPPIYPFIGELLLGGDCYSSAFINIFWGGWESANLVWEGMASDLFKRRWWFAFYLKGNYHLVMHLGRDGHQSIHSFGRGWPPIYPFIWEGMACNLHIHVWRHGNQSTHSFWKGWPPIFPCM